MLKKIFYKVLGFYPDKEIHNIVLLKYFNEKLLCMLRAILLFRRSKIFIGKNVKIQNKKLLYIKEWVNIANNVYIDALSKNGVYLGSHVSVGKNTRIECTGSFSKLGVGFSCGNNCGLGTDSFYGAAGGIEIGNDVIVGNFVSMHSENHIYSDLYIPIRLQGVKQKGIKIGNNCWIGAKVTILDGTIIGNGCVIAAGAVVTGVFPDNVVLGGIPAKIIKHRENNEY